MAFTLNRKVESGKTMADIEKNLGMMKEAKMKEVEEKLKQHTQLQTFYDLASLARRDSFGEMGRGGKKHTPQWYMSNGVTFETLQWLSKEGYIGKNIRKSGTKDVYINWKNNPQKSYSKPLEDLDLTLF